MHDETTAQAPLHCCHPYLLHLVLVTLLFASPSWIFPASRIEHIPKYSAIEKFIKLPFQQVVIRFKQSYDRFTLALRAVQKISECTTFDVLAIIPCRKLRLTSFLICWNQNFMGLLNIQKYTAIFF